MNRRQVLQLGAAATCLVSCGDIGWASGGGERPTPTRPDGVDLPESRWREVLTAGEYRILRESGTERAFTGDLWDNKADGVYLCAGCGLPLFDSSTKFRSGTGWPSFYQPLDKDRVQDITDLSMGMVRTENVCARCGGHLGHVFHDGPRPTGLRYCMNSASLDFVPRKQVGEIGDPAPVRLGGWDAAPTEAPGPKAPTAPPGATP